MQLQHAFDVPLSMPTTWDLLTQIDQIATCLPGAKAIRTGKDTFQGTVRTRLGPLDMTFKGSIEITDHDLVSRRMVMRSKGSEAKGQGSASATTVAVLTEKDGGTHVALETELVISGRVAQMGRGMVVEVSNDLLERFVANLKRDFGTVEASPTTNASLEAGAPPLTTPARNVSSAAVRSPAKTASTEDAVDLGNLFWRMLWRKIRALFGLAKP